MATFNKKDSIGPYIVIFPIKEGAYAESYRVKDLNNTNYFLKLFDYSKLDRKQYHGEQITEIEISKLCHHENLAEYHDSGDVVANGRRYAYVVFKYISGETIEERVKRERYCSVYDAIQIALGTLNGLDYLHSLSKPIIHKEITLQNIMLDMTSEGIHPRIIDFGHAGFLSDPYNSFDKTGLDPFYMAPESFNGVFSVQSDIFSVGALLYHLVFGIPPYFVDPQKYLTRESLEDAIVDQRKGPVRFPEKSKFELDENTLNVITKALAMNVDDRFPTAAEFAAALRGEITVGPIKQRKAAEDKSASPVSSSIKKGNGFADVAGMEELKEKLRYDVIDLLKHPDEAKEWGISIPNGLLFYGPPGCGKTYFAEKFAEEAGCSFISVKCSDIATPYIHGGQEKIGALFAEARKSAPCIVFLDEIDAMLSSRSLQDNSSMAGEVNEFLTQLNNCGELGIIVIGATNLPTKIDKAALRAGRLELKYYIPQPSLDVRESLFKIYLNKTKTDLGMNYLELAEKTENYVSSQIRLIVDEAIRLCRRRKVPFITMDILREVIGTIKPDLTAEDVKHYEEIRNAFEGTKPREERRRIGFK